MRGVERTSLLAVLATAAMSIAVGILLQFGLASRGAPTLVPPVSLAVTLFMLAAVLLAFGVRLRRQVTRRPGDVNPFHAVRLLVTARAAQFAGALLGGIGAGLGLALMGRSVAPSVELWLPMVLTALGGAALVVCAIVTEQLCRVPPGDGENGESEDTAPDPAPSDQPAFRKP